MRVLVACERFQKTCKAFRARGHEAYSCDIVPVDMFNGNPDWHIIGDAIEVAYGQQWDLMIAHPPCTYMSNAGARWMYKAGTLQPDRYELAMKAKEFFMKLLDSPIKKKCIENPQPMKVVELPKHTQVVQPFMFGDPFTKKTLLWLEGLPLLVAQNAVIDGIKPYLQSGGKNAELSKIRGDRRSETFDGMANAFAEQWG